ncbi:MAG: D-fructose-6-phosphate amidotransferase [Candidatus Rokubacteria bacterium 13_1_40CM_4_69_5]|nr:MAG: D-fructose-6-phosphate amidotransferase [Candidatus Rokubacteria bacterium 13_1_40CM_4_69_5]OLE39940.1 MAG: D-fructose-6-phosphate amidotransferase [Candidatus Rokubacteria bacterium 13_1_20CM_2_70_7]
MSAYLIADVSITDPTGFEEYRKQVPATLAKHGGRFVARGGAIHTLEGDWRPQRLVVLEFPSVEQARRWYDSEEYRGPKALRLRTAKTNLILVEGMA